MVPISVEIATAYISLVPSMRGAQGTIAKELGGSKVQGAAQGAGRSLGSRIVRGIGIAAAAAGGVAAAIGIRNLGSAALESASGIQNANATLTGLLGSADSATDTMSRLRDVARTSPIQYQTYLRAAESLAYMGYEGADAEGILENVGAAVTAAGGDSTGMDRATGAMLQMVNSGRVYAAQLNQISDAGIPVFSGLAEHFGTNIENVREMVSAGQVSIEDVMEVIQNASGDTFQAMLAASDEASGTFSNQWAIAKDNVVTALGEQLVPALDALAPVVGDIGGAVEGFIGNMSGWVGTGSEAIANFIEQFRAGEGPAGRFREVLEAVRDAAVSFGTWLRDTLKPVFDDIWGFVTDTALPAIGGLVDGFIDGEGAGGGFRTVLEGVRDVLKGVTEWLVEHRTLIYGVVGAYALWRTVNAIMATYRAISLGVTAATYGKAGAMVVAGTSARVYNAIMRVQAIQTAAVTVATKAKTAAMWLLNAAMRANPIGIIITLLVALGAGLALAWNKSETFRNIVTGVWDAIKNAAEAAWGFIRDNVFEPLKAAWESVSGWFSDRGEDIKGAWNGVKDGIAAGWNAISGTWDSLKDGLSSVGSWFSDRGEDIKNAWGGVRDGLSAGWQSIRDNTFSAFQDRFAQVTNFFENDSGAIGTSFRWLRDQLSRAWNWIDRNVFAVFRDAFNLVRALFSRDSDQINRAWERLRARLVQIWHAIRATVFQAFRNAVQGVKDFFSNRVADIRGIWDGLRGAMRGVYNWINTNVFQRFRDGLSWLGDRVADARDRIRRIWETVANTFRRPINWVIRNVWNDGIASVFNRVADAIGISTRLNTASELPMYAKGGHAKKGWALVGEEGPELVRFPQAGYVYPAGETARMLGRGGPGTGEDFSETHPPDGGIWGGIANAVGSAVDWVRGGLADLAGAVLDPIVDRIAGGLSGYGSTGELFGDTMTSAVDSLMDWIRGEDDVMKGVLGPGFKESGAAGRIQGATAAMNAAAWNIWNAIPGLRGMHSLTSSMVGPHKTGNAVDFYGPSNTLAATAAYAARNAAQLGIRQVIYNWRLWQGGGWGRLGSTGGNDPGHVWHVHVASHGGGARMWDAPRHIGRPGVYDNGGWLPSGGAALNLSGRPEAVLDPDESRALKAGLGGERRYVAEIHQHKGASAEDLAEDLLFAMRRRDRAGLYSRERAGL